MRKYKFIAGVVCLFCLMIFSGCSSSLLKDDKSKPKSQLTILLEEFTNWDDTKTRIEKRHKQIVLKAVEELASFEKLGKNEQNTDVSAYLYRVKKLAALLPHKDSVFKNEGQTVIFAHRYLEAIQNRMKLLADVDNKMNNVRVQRELFDAKLGYEFAYKNAMANKKTETLTAAKIGKIGKGMSYEEVAQLIGRPGVVSDVFVSANDKSKVAQTLCVWAEGERHILIRFVNNKVVGVKSENLKM